MNIALFLDKEMNKEEEVKNILLDSEFAIYDLFDPIGKFFEKLSYQDTFHSRKVIFFKEECEKIFGENVWCELVNKKYNILIEMHKGYSEEAVIPDIAIINLTDINEIKYWKQKDFIIIGYGYRYIDYCDIVINNIGELKEIINKLKKEN